MSTCQFITRGEEFVQLLTQREQQELQTFLKIFKENVKYFFFSFFMKPLP
jgi:hypothetical protein